MPIIQSEGWPCSDSRRATTCSGMVLPLRSTTIASFGDTAASCCTSLPIPRKSVAGLPFTLTMRSPASMPASAAGWSGSTVAATAGAGIGSRPRVVKYWSTVWPGGSLSSGSSRRRCVPSGSRTVSGSGVRPSRAFATTSSESPQVSTSRPAMLRMRSPGWMPAWAAMLCGLAVTMGALSGRPTMNISHSAATVNSRLKPGPASTIRMRFHTGWPVNSWPCSCGGTTPSRASSIFT